MHTTGLSEDYCRCGHVASQHADGEGRCAQCRSTATWGRTTRCVQFSWAETWESARRSA